MCDNIPTIVFYGNDKLETELLLIPNKDYDHNYLFFIYDLKNIIKHEDGEYLISGYVLNKNMTDVENIIFAKPRKITYFVMINDKQDEILYNQVKNFKCLKTGSLYHNKIIDNKLIQKILISPSDIIHIYYNEKLPDYFENIMINNVCNNNISNNVPELDFLIKKNIYEYFLQNATEQYVVLKNTSYDTYGSNYVKIISNNDLLIDEKIKQITIKNGNIIIEKFYDNKLIPENKYHRIRVYYQKSEKIYNTISDLFYNFSQTPICNGNSSYLKINYKTSDIIRKQIYKICNEYYNSINNYIYNIDSCYENILLGFDFVLCGNGHIKCIEVNNIDSVSNALIIMSADICNPIKEFYNYIISRSYDYLLQNKYIIIVGYGSFSKIEIFKYCAKNKIKIIFIDKHLYDIESYIDHFIQIDLCNINEYNNETDIIKKYIEKHNLDIFSIITLYDDYVPFKILLQDKLNLKYNYKTSYDESLINKDKFKISKKYNEHCKNHFGIYNIIFDIGVYQFIDDYILLTDENIHNIQINEKKIMKISSGSSAYGCNKINNNTDLIKTYFETKQLIEKTNNDSGFGTMFNPIIFISPLYIGSEHDIDIIMCNGICIFSVCSDNINNTNSCNMSEKGCIMPSRIINDIEHKFIQQYVIYVLRILNLNHGVYNVEFFKTDNGIKIIDINPRPGGYYINDWIQKLYGINTFKYEILLNSPLENIYIYNTTTQNSLDGTAIYNKIELINKKYDYIFYNDNMLDNSNNNIDMIAQIATIIHKI